MSAVSPCEPDPSSGRVSLLGVLRSFGAPLSEAWAWALAHQACRALADLLDGARRPLFLVREAEELSLHQESGTVHAESFTRPGKNRLPLLSENKAVSELGLLLYTSLDFGLGEHEQRSLSESLEDLLETMVAANNETDDEGIGDDEEDSLKPTGFTFKIMEMCASQLSSPSSESATHFSAVVRAMVAEALELSSFMRKVTSYDDDRAEELKALDLQDWARLWVQCMQDLRQGVKLKKINYTKTPVEFELTPYEMLMDDIRSRRYKLNKVMVDGEVPMKVKRDAHDIILDFIKSRPPLKPAENRELPPLKVQSSPVELLMQSIRNSSARSSLRKTSGPRIKSNFLGVKGGGAAKDEEEADGQSKQVLTIDSNELSTLLNFNTDAEDTDVESTSVSRQISRDEEEPDSVGHQALNLKKLYVKSDSPSDSSRATTSSSASTTPATSGRATPTTSGRATPTAEMFGGFNVRKPKAAKSKKRRERVNTPQMHANLQSELLKSEHWSTALRTLELNLDEVIHIRTVLTRAEMEGLPLEGSLREDVEKGKICFLCMKTRFGFFTWGVRCQLCKQQVCNKCSSKMHIPHEHFSAVPASMLSSRAIPTNNNNVSRRKSFHVASGGADKANSSAPASPKFKRRAAVNRSLRARGSLNELYRLDRGEESCDEDDDEDEEEYWEEDELDEYGPVSLPVTQADAKKPARKSFGGYVRHSISPSSSSSSSNRLQVCSDCREMIAQVVRAQRTAQRMQLTAQLYGGAAVGAQEK